MSELKSDMLHGLFWSAIEKYSGLAVNFIVSMILARLISPNEFGIVAIATVIIQFLSMFATMGIGPAVIQRKDLTVNDLNNIYSFSIIVGLMLSLILFVSSWPIAKFYDNETLIPICQLLCVNLFFAAANMVPSALMSRDLRFKQIAKRTLILQLTTGSLAVAAAFYGVGAYALLISPIFTSIGIYFFNRRFYVLKFCRKIDFTPIKSIMGFSMYQLAFEFVNYFSRNLDKLIIGRHMGLSELGYYEKSYRLMQMPLHSLTGVINPVIQPVLSSIQDDRTMIAEKYNTMIKLIAAISFPLGGFLFLYADTIITIIYGHNWENAIPVFKILALSVPLQLILSTSGGVMLACNAAKAQFWIGIRNTATTVTGFIIAAVFFSTIESIAWAWTITLGCNFVVSYFLLYRKVLKSSFFSMLRLLTLPVVCFILLLLLDNLLLSCSLNIVFRILGSVIVSFVFVWKIGVFQYIRLNKKHEKID